MPAVAIYTADEIANELFGKTDSSALSSEQVTMIEASIRAATALVCAFLQRSLEFASRTEIVSLEDELNANPILPALQTSEPRTVINLIHVPVQLADLVVWENDDRQVFENAHLLVAGTDYQLENVVSGLSVTGVLRRLGKPWPKAPGAVKITYTGGLDVINSPDNWSLIRRATLVTVREEFAKLQILSNFSAGDEAGLLESESIGDYKASYDSTQAGDILFNRNTGKLNGLPYEAVWILEPLISYGVWL